MVSSDVTSGCSWKVFVLSVGYWEKGARIRVFPIRADGGQNSFGLPPQQNISIWKV